MAGHLPTQSGTHSHPHPHDHHGGHSHATAAPRIVISFTPAGPHYAISQNAEMPSVKASAKLENVTLNLGEQLEFRWSASVTFHGHGCPHAMGRQTSHTPIQARTMTPEWRIPFSQTRGGVLSVTVGVQVNHKTLSATANNLRILGTNPTTSTLATVSYPCDGFKKLMRLESGLRQFRAALGDESLCPLFSSDNFGGVGICQITLPHPTDEQVWNWKANVQAGIALWKLKEDAARAFFKGQQTSPHFRDLVKKYNQRRQQHKQPALTITLPDFTDEQLQNDTLRGFNGYAGGWHEYRIAADASGHLVVTLDPSGTTGTAEWHRNTAAERIAHYQAINLDKKNWGDPNYVDDVLAQASF